MVEGSRLREGGELIADTLKLLDEMLPPATELQEIHTQRVQKLIELAE